MTLAEKFPCLWFLSPTPRKECISSSISESSYRDSIISRQSTASRTHFITASPDTVILFCCCCSIRGFVSKLILRMLLSFSLNIFGGLLHSLNNKLWRNKHTCYLSSLRMNCFAWINKYLISFKYSVTFIPMYLFIYNSALGQNGWLESSFTHLYHVPPRNGCLLSTAVTESEEFHCRLICRG